MKDDGAEVQKAAAISASVFLAINAHGSHIKSGLEAHRHKTKYILHGDNILL
jgi:hypothetical protein